MSISASVVKELRERTGAGMMECKKALVETDGDIEAAQELLRTKGQASADKKAGRVAAEGRIEIAQGDNAERATILELNCETDFVGKDENFVQLSREAAAVALAENAPDVETLLDCKLADGRSLEEARRDLIAKVGENISVRRVDQISSGGQVGTYLHGSRIGVAVAVQGGDDELRRDLAMHIAASAPMCVSADDVPSEILDKERRILTEQAEQEGKPAEIVAKMVEGRLRKYLGEVTLLGQPFVKDPDTKVEQLVKEKSATITSFVRYEVGEGIEKKTENFAEEVQAQLQA